MLLVYGTMWQPIHGRALQRLRACVFILRWFDRPAHNRVGLLQLSLPRKAMVRILRFRIGCHACFA